MEKKDNKPRYTCREYREEMTLLGLRRLLEKKDLPSTEREKIEKKIKKIEEEMGL